MKVLVTGAGGQLGRALQATAPAGATLLAAGSDRLDIGDARAVEALVSAERPALILNAAAYTRVDEAEAHEADAARINADAVGHLASAARKHGARLVQVSTDFVFDGRQGVPYAPDAATDPLNAYGRTKLAGEQAVGPDGLIVRTAWVYAATGQNFVLSMLRRMTAGQDLRVVADQIGTPTHAVDLARALWDLAAKGATGIHHFTDSGVASWYDFAVAIQEEALAIGLLTAPIAITPIATADYPTPARRPAFSVLDKSATYAALGAPAPHWRVSLRRMLNEVLASHD